MFALVVIKKLAIIDCNMGENFATWATVNFFQPIIDLDVIRGFLMAKD